MAAFATPASSIAGDVLLERDRPVAGPAGLLAAQRRERVAFWYRWK